MTNTVAKMSVKGYGVTVAKEDVHALQFERRAPRPDDVVIDVLYCGVCHSDIHMIRDDWGWVKEYPVVPGHEVVGKVIEIGDEVTKFSVGDTVGIGCMVDSCRSCGPCKQGLEQHCDEGCTLTYGSHDRHDKMLTFGGYSEKILASEKYVVKVPAGMDLAAAAPLLCAGITMWSPLRHWKVGPETRVAIVGLGGLGHMGLKLAKALGAKEVTLFTRSASQEADARSLGADRIVVSTDAKQMEAVKGHFDIIIDTVPSNHDINPYIPTLAFTGTIILVGYLGELKDPGLNTVAVVLGRKSVAGSQIGGIAETQEMLNFCSEHGVTSDVEMIPIQDINKAYERMEKSDVKYRFVIDMASLKEEKNGAGQ